ncbi:septum site-determining protein MinD [Natranaerobius thermophilus]|uniref:Septum site-determining protein MinD n=1 Tax=Natranaerobius thermophilus (strain ATCC BAA-1301 / DSM 18059 / JW/NM-WN-LF) TaxID=457570 RepID=B2A6A5_NATTJ|nr:septum site-determining protein MinD [Natranaerobius thermophilus]ACB84116.1 septum site-determining protein MinD [Natranaerobius thermophilus JW/NM-WN-LF]
MGEVIVVTSGKGGVGKTTTVANVGTGLALKNKSVALLDADIGLRNLDVILGLENRIVYDMVDVTQGQAKLNQALIKDKRFPDLYLLPAPQTKDKTAINPDEMRNLCGELKSKFDYVIVDSPAGIEQGFQNAIAGADRAIVVTTPEVTAARDADRIIGLLEAEEINDHKLIINRIRPDMVHRNDMLDIDDIIGLLSIELLGVVPDDEQVIVSTNKGEPLASQTGKKASRAYQNITRRIMGEKVPLMTLDHDSGIMNKLKKFIGLAN